MYAQDEGLRVFRNAYVLKPGFNYSTLKPYVERIKFASDGMGDEVDSVRQQLEEGFSDFDARTDVVIPVGVSWINFLAGTIIQRKVLEDINSDSYLIGIWQEGGYKFYRVPLQVGHETEYVPM
jgi:hypothetical protein